MEMEALVAKLKPCKSRPTLETLIPCWSLSTVLDRIKTFGPQNVSAEVKQLRKTGDDVTTWQTLAGVMDHDVVSHDDICATIAKKVERHR